MESILGGILIGTAATLMLLFTGRVTGISGILGGIMNPRVLDKSWRVFFILGLLLGGVILKLLYPTAFSLDETVSLPHYLIAGFLVGFGTLLGNGCTSGHGVCGISRLSIRSIIATVTFIVFGALGVLL